MAELRDKAESRRRKREYIIIVFLIIAVAALTATEVRFSRLSGELPVGNNILFFALLNIDLVLVLLLIFLVVRNITKLFVEYRRGIFGSKLKTRLVSAFVALTVLPTVVIFFMALKFMSYSLESWFDPQVEKVFVTGNDIVQGKYVDDGEEAMHFARQVRDYVQDMGLLKPDQSVALKDFLESKRREYDLADIRIVWNAKKPATITMGSGLKLSEAEMAPGGDFVKKAFEGQEGYMMSPFKDFDVIRAIVPIHHEGPTGPIIAAIVAQTIIDKSLFQQMNSNQLGYQNYMTMRRLKSPIKTAHITFLVITSLLVIFGASWFGFHIAKTLTAPLERLASATELVAKGDLAARLDVEGQDEMSELARSFNRMTIQLETSAHELEMTYSALEQKNVELDRRRRYMEIVLANVAAGVISVDANANVTTVNKSAERMFKINVPHVIGKSYNMALTPENQMLLRELIRELRARNEGSIQRAIMLTIGGSPIHFQVTLTELRSDDDEVVGLVAIFEDMTQILQAQKAVAWREVARRIAHEIKNPLTPIQLYAERLQRRYAGKIGGEDEKIFKESVDLIIDQVQALRNLVDEFRQFARMPSAKPAPADLNETIRDATMLFQEAVRSVKFTMSLDPATPVFDIDREQIKRMMNNLLDNAVAAMDGAGEVSIKTTFNRGLQMARIEVADSGRGVPLKDRERIFEPDFSTKKGGGGTGLGLAIVQRIVSDHFGFIRVTENKPKGAVFVIEMPTHLPRLGVAAPGANENETDTEDLEDPLSQEKV